MSGSCPKMHIQVTWATQLFIDVNYASGTPLTSTRSILVFVCTLLLCIATIQNNPSTTSPPAAPSYTPQQLLAMHQRREQARQEVSSDVCGCLEGRDQHFHSDMWRP